LTKILAHLPRVGRSNGDVSITSPVLATADYGLFNERR